jgi:Transposase DDE domain group 1
LDDAPALASAPTLSRFEHQIHRQDAYRLARAFVEHFVASYATPPEAIVLDLDHTDDSTHGQQELALYNHHYRTYCYLPLFIVEGTSQALAPRAFALASGPRERKTP